MVAENLRRHFSWLLARSDERSRAAEQPLIRTDKGPRSLALDISNDDPLLRYFLREPGAVEIQQLDFESPALEAMRREGVKLVVPLVSQGELIGLLNLGSRRSEQGYSIDDRRMLNTLATQAAPALRVAQLARLQQVEARERERVEQELRVARVIQETLLPRQLPELDRWMLEAYWQPARAVSGDFYDFCDFPDGRLGIVVADVTDKGVPAALVMATARSLIRAAAERYIQPGEVLRRVNDLLCPDIPPKMFVTCLYLLLDPNTGELILANAGHNLPIWRCGQEVKELRATGMPLGLFPGMQYDEADARIEPGDRLLLYSDGIVEAHNPEADMFGFPRLHRLIAEAQRGAPITDALVQALAEFTGPDWEQEDDVTLLTIERLSDQPETEARMMPDTAWSLLADLTIPSVPGNERRAMDEVAQIVAGVGLRQAVLDRLKTAVAEATMNAMEHGNLYRDDLPVEIQVYRSGSAVKVRISDYGGGKVISEPVKPDLDAKLEGTQSPRGWGLFLIENMVDEMHVNNDGVHHIVELIMRSEVNDG